MTCDGAAVVWQWRGSSKTRFPIDSKLLWIVKSFFCHLSNGRFGLHNMASVPVYCLCRLPYDVTRFMIECDICQDWFHGRWVFWWLKHIVTAKLQVYVLVVNPFSSATSSVCCVWIILRSCVGVEEDKAAEIDLYHCPNCQVTHGPSVSKYFSS